MFFRKAMFCDEGLHVWARAAVGTKALGKFHVCKRVTGRALSLSHLGQVIGVIIGMDMNLIGLVRGDINLRVRVETQFNRHWLKYNP